MKNMFTVNMKSIIKLFLLIVLYSGISNATVVNGRAVLDSYNDTLYSIKLQINTNTGSDDMGGATIVIRYDSTQLFFPDFPVAGIHYVFHNFSSGTYSPALVTKVLGNRLWLNIELNSDNQGFVVAGNSDWTDLATLYFTKRVQSPAESITWETESDFWSIYDGDNSTFWTAGNFNSSTNVQNQAASPENFELLQNYPNPFNPSTTISFNLKSGGDVVLTVYNALGETVETLFNSNMKAGNHKIDFNAADLSSGIYFYKLSVDNKFTSIKKMILMK